MAYQGLFLKRVMDPHITRAAHLSRHAGLTIVTTGRGAQKRADLKTLPRVGTISDCKARQSMLSLPLRFQIPIYQMRRPQNTKIESTLRL